MAPVVRRRTKAMLVVAGLLLVAVVALAWFLASEDDPADGTAAGVGATTADPAAGPAGPDPTTATNPAATEGTSASGDQAGRGATDIVAWPLVNCKPHL